MFDGKAFGQEVVSVVKEYLDRSLEPVMARMTEIEARIAALPVPKDGKDADQDAVAEVVASIITGNMRKDFEELRAAVDAIPAQPDIPTMIAEAVAAISPPDVEPIIAEKVAAAVAALPVPADGKDADPELIASLVGAEVAKLPRAVDGKDGLPGEPGRDGADGKDIDTEEVKAAIVAHVAMLVEATLMGWERPQDGKSVTAEELAPLIEESAQRAVAAIPVPKDGEDGKDGADVVDLLIDRDGALVAALSNGKTKTIGPVVGKDGAPGIDGKDGEPGKDGADGLGFEDMTQELDEEGRTIIQRYVRGDIVKEFRYPVAAVLFRGVFKEGADYVAGDSVTWAGCTWIAKEPTNAKPEMNGGPWQLSVKKGRDGKDGRTLPPVKAGPVKV